jgi:hypothetical protein
MRGVDEPARRALGHLTEPSSPPTLTGSPPGSSGLTRSPQKWKNCATGWRSSSSGAERQPCGAKVARYLHLN